MTNEEAVRILKYKLNASYSEYRKALYMAIDALEVLDEVIDIALDEENEASTQECLCRKLKQYGFLELKDGYYERVEE